MRQYTTSAYQRFLILFVYYGQLLDI